MLRAPVQFGKLCERLPLIPTIPAHTWRDSLPQRFRSAGLAIEAGALEALVAFGDGRPYATMAAARYAALNARRLGGEEVGSFEVEEGIAEARRHLEEGA